MLRARVLVARLGGDGLCAPTQSDGRKFIDPFFCDNSIEGDVPVVCCEDLLTLLELMGQADQLGSSPMASLRFE